MSEGSRSCGPRQEQEGAAFLPAAWGPRLWPPRSPQRGALRPAPCRVQAKWQTAPYRAVSHGSHGSTPPCARGPFPPPVESEFGASHRGKWGKGSHFSREGGSGTGIQGLGLQKRTLHPRGGRALRQHSAWETGGTRTDLRTVVKHMLLILFLLEQGSTAFLTGSPGSSVHFHSSTSMNYPVQADIENTRFLLGRAW